MSGLALWLLIGFGIVVVIVVAMTTMAIYGYKRLEVSFTSLRIYPEFRVNRSSLLGALVGVVTRNFVSAAGGFIKGAKVEGKIHIFNPGKVPLYLPDSEHGVTVEGQRSPQAIRVGAFWLKPGATRVIPIYINLGKEHIPQIALKILTRGGKINIEIRSRAKLGPFSYKRTTKLSPGVSRPATKPSTTGLTAKTGLA